MRSGFICLENRGQEGLETMVRGNRMEKIEYELMRWNIV
jgi:hypothetical protein